jgi:hypothetical protein
MAPATAENAKPAKAETSAPENAAALSRKAEQEICYDIRHNFILLDRAIAFFTRPRVSIPTRAVRPMAIDRN